MSLSSSPFKYVALLAAALVPVALTGCANMVTTDTTSSTPAAKVSGNVHGGQQPISGATINLYAAGTTGYGSTPTLFATTTSSNDGGASFAFTQLASSPTFPTGIHDTTSNVYSCPTTGNPQMYLVAKGGSTGGPLTPVNSAAALIIALGPCSGAGSLYVTMDESTTIATLAALQQFFNPALEGFGYNNTAQSVLGFSNALGTISTLVNTAGGGVGANQTFTPASSLAGVTVTAIPEFAKINTMANILAACINTTSNTSTGCTTLFTNAVPPASSAVTSQPGTTINPTTYLTAVDTLQAAYYMLVNPTDGGTAALGNLFTLGGTGIVPFQPALTAAPTDWNIGVTYASTSSPTTNVPVLGFAEYLAVDANGNIWVANHETASATSNPPLAASLVELSPTGGVIQQVLTGGQLYGPGEIAIDPAGNVWVPNFGTTTPTSPFGYQKTVVEFPASGSPATGKVFNVAGGPFGVASDGVGNIFVGEATKAITNTGGGNGTPGADVEEIPAGSAAGTTPTVISSVIPGYAADLFSAIEVDSKYRVYLTSDVSSLFALIPTASGSGSATTYAYNSALVGTVSSTGLASLAIDNADHAWATNFVNMTTSQGPLYEFSITGAAGSQVLAANPSSGVTGGGLDFISLSAVDGAGNIWVSDNTTTIEVSEFSNAGVPLSPTTGFVHTTDDPVGIAIDPSGNVWLGGAASSTHAAAAGKVAAGGYITELVGAAVPVVTPIAAGLPAIAGGTSLLGTKP
jgi:hypothetical protein